MTKVAFLSRKEDDWELAYWGLQATSLLVYALPWSSVFLPKLKPLKRPREGRWQAAKLGHRLEGVPGSFHAWPDRAGSVLSGGRGLTEAPC